MKGAKRGSKGGGMDGGSPARVHWFVGQWSRKLIGLSGAKGRAARKKKKKGNDEL